MIKAPLPRPQARALIEYLDRLTDLLTPARRPQDASAPECSRTELRVLHALARKQPIATTALALSLDVPASTLTRAMDQLVKKGLVERRRDENDRRVIEVRFSRNGSEINRFAARARLRQARALLKKLSAGECDRLFDGLSKLTEG